jgi:hypothetical protein
MMTDRLCGGCEHMPCTLNVDTFNEEVTGVDFWCREAELVR